MHSARRRQAGVGLNGGHTCTSTGAHAEPCASAQPALGTVRHRRHDVSSELSSELGRGEPRVHVHVHVAGCGNNHVAIGRVLTGTQSFA